MPHSTRRVFDDDRARQNDLVDDEWCIYRITKTMLEGDLLATFRRKVANATGLARQEANTFIADYIAGLEGYTYLEGEAAR